MDYKEIKPLLDKYFEGNTTLKEENTLLVFFSGNTPIPHEWVAARELLNSIKTEKTIHYPNKNRKKLLIVFSGMAASIAILLASIFYIPGNRSTNQQITKHNTSNTPEKIILANENVLWLNKGASVSYFTMKNPMVNIIDLKGEAYFEITNPKASNYQVLVENTMIQTDRPTSFNINTSSRNDNIEIIVKSGLIRVYSGEANRGLGIMVTQGNYCSVHKTENLAFVSENRNSNYLSWKTGELIFNDLPLASVTEVLENHYHVSIQFTNDSLAYCMFSGSYKNKQLDYILKQIKKEFNFNINQENNHITLVGNNCI